MQEFYSPKKAAEILSVNREHILRLINSGKLPASNVGTGHRNVYRISKQDLDNFINQNNKTHGQSRDPKN